MRTVRLTGRGAGVLVLGVVTSGAGLWWSYPGVTGLGAAFLVLVALSVLAVAVRAPLAADRTVAPLEVARFGACEGTLTVDRRAGLLPVELAAHEPVGDDGEVTVDLPPDGTGRASVTYAIPTTRRGLLTVGPLRLERRGVAGLAVRAHDVGAPVTVRVLPRSLPVRGLPQGVRRGQVGADERAEQGGTDLVGLHEYVPGDDLRRLHWATSARTGVLMVRDDADPSRPHLVVFLDDRPAAYREPDEDFEEAVDVAAALASHAAEDGHPVHLLTVSGAVDLATDGATDGRVDAAGPALLQALAEVQLADHGAISAAGIPTRDLDVVAVVTGAVDGDVADGLLLDAGRASAGVVLRVDPAPRRTTSVAETVTVLHGARADDLLAAWDARVVGVRPEPAIGTGS